MIRIAIFASGSGTNAIELIKTAKRLTNVLIPLVIINRKESTLFEALKKQFPEVEALFLKEEAEMLVACQKRDIHWCFLAGFMKILSPKFLKAFKNKEDSFHRVVNIHPSLLPKFPGLHAYEKNFQDSSETHGGVTIHLVDEGMDTGPILAQASFPKVSDESEETFITRGKQLEWKMYPEILCQLAAEGDLTPKEKV